MPKFETKTYTSLKKRDKDLGKRLDKGWTVHSETLTQDRSFWKFLLAGPFAFRKKNKWHVTYTK